MLSLTLKAYLHIKARQHTTHSNAPVLFQYKLIFIHLNKIQNCLEKYTFIHLFIHSYFHLLWVTLPVWNATTTTLLLNILLHLHLFKRMAFGNKKATRAAVVNSLFFGLEYKRNRKKWDSSKYRKLRFKRKLGKRKIYRWKK